MIDLYGHFCTYLPAAPDVEAVMIVAHAGLHVDPVRGLVADHRQYPGDIVRSDAAGVTDPDWLIRCWARRPARGFGAGAAGGIEQPVHPRIGGEGALALQDGCHGMAEASAELVDPGADEAGINRLAGIHLDAAEAFQAVFDLPRQLALGEQLP